MRCPKCHYLSFEPEPRCRNCGFDLAGDPVDVALKRDEPEGPLADLALRSASAQPPRAAPPSPVAMPVSMPASPAVSSVSSPSALSSASVKASANDPHRRASAVVGIVPVPPPPAPPAPRVSPPGSGTTDLPLFVKGLSTASPAPPSPISNPAPPHAPPPVAVQRPVQSPPRAAQPARSGLPPRKPGPFDGDLLEDLQRIERIERGHPSDPPIVRHTPPAARMSESAQAEPWRGLLAAAIDATFIGLLNVAIFWITLRWTGLAFVDASLLPVLPLGTFFILVALGYLAMFTAAGGQTVGKMVAGVRVVAAEPGGADAPPLTVQQALLRSVLAVPSVLLLGLGFLPAVLGTGKSFHDRLAHTRIVRA